jgi:putative membrane protein
VGYKTAISPNSLVDTLIAAYWSFVLLRDLCLIYNVRVGALGTVALLWRAFFTAYLAGKFHDWEDHTDYTFEAIMDGLPEIGRKIAGKLAAKAGTGLANYFMVRRLGRRAIALLKPLAVDTNQDPSHVALNDPSRPFRREGLGG